MNRLDSLAPKFLSLLRVVAGLMFLEHGTQKILHFPAPLPVGPAAAAAAAAAKAAGHGVSPIVTASGWIELVGGALIALGLFTRSAAFICSGEMAVGYFIAHMPRSFFPVNSLGDAAVLYCFVFLYFVFSGPGPYALDAALPKKA